MTRLPWYHLVLALCIQQGALLLYIGQMIAWSPVGATRSLALVHAVQIRGLEGLVYGGVESSLSSAAPFYAVNVAYLWLHLCMVVLILPLCWLLASHLLYRVALALASAALCNGLVAAVYPLAPPRLTPGFSDGLRLIGAAGPGQSWDAYSAMPSYHMVVAFAVLSIPLWAGVGRVASPGAVFLGYCYALLIGYLVLASANHWVLDIVGAALCWGLSCVVADRILHLGGWVEGTAARLLARRVPSQGAAPASEVSERVSA